MAETENKKQLISSILDELKELEMLTQGMNNPELLEELALKKAKDLVAQYERLKAMPEEAPVSVPAEPKFTFATPSEKETPIVFTCEPEVKKEPEPVVAPKVEVPVATVDKTAVAPSIPPVAEPVKVEQPKVEEKIQVQPTENKWQQPAIQTNNDKFKQTGANGTNKRLIETMYVKSLKSALNINDKIRFNRTLFNGDTNLMNATIDEIDRMNNLGEALSYINAKFNWDKEDEAVSEFLALLERRF